MLLDFLVNKASVDEGTREIALEMLAYIAQYTNYKRAFYFPNWRNIFS